MVFAARTQIECPLERGFLLVQGWAPAVLEG
jgi:hypothetical protein